MNLFDTALMMIRSAAETKTDCYNDLTRLLNEHKSILSADDYLVTMSRIGLVDFSNETKEIVLTELGRYTETLFDLSNHMVTFVQAIC